MCRHVTAPFVGSTCPFVDGVYKVKTMTKGSDVKINPATVSSVEVAGSTVTLSGPGTCHTDRSWVVH